MEDYLIKIATEELNESPQRTKNDLAALNEWILKQPHLIARTDEKFLISFLRNAKYRLEGAKQKVDSYHTFRTICAEHFKNRAPLPTNQHNLLIKGTFVPLLQPNPKDYGRITINVLKQIAENDCTVSDSFKIVLMVNDKYLVTDECATITGQHTIIDFEGTTMITATQSIAIAKKLVTGLEDVYPVRIIAFHLINLKKAPPLFELVIKTFKGLCKTKLGERIRIHDTLESLYKEIPKSMLPTEYGGDAGSCEALMEKFMKVTNFDDDKWFLDDEKYKTDESKRIGGSKVNDLFGTDGSFRQMDID